MLADFGLKIRPFWRLRSRKLICSLFSKIKGSLRERLTSDYLDTYLAKSVYGQKVKEIDFSTLATRWSIFRDGRS